MKNSLIPFDYHGHQLRTVSVDGEPWFVAKDACEILDLGNPSQAISRLDTDERNTLILNEGIGNPEKSIISESGLYSLILGSKKPEARPFKRWVTHDVIPSIRKHGAYMTPETLEKVLLNPDTIIQLATRLKEEQAKRRELEAESELNKPKVLFADSVSGSKNSILIRDLAKLIKQNGYDIGEKRLFAWLRENGYLIAQPGRDRNSPAQKSMNLGIMELKERTVSSASGTYIQKTPLVTGRGQQYFIKKFCKGGSKVA